MTADRSHALAGLASQAETDATGCVHIHDRSRTHSAQAYFAEGKVYAVHVDGFRPAIADRMLTAGLLDQVLHDQVIAAAGGDPRNADIGNLAVRRGMVAQETLDAIHREVLLSAVAAIATWAGPKSRFRKGQTTTTYTVPAVPVAAVLAAVERRAQHWDAIWRELAPGCPPNQAIPRRTDQFPVAIDHSPDTRALLAHVDGLRTVDDLAGLCGLTRFETGHLLHGLALAGVVSLTPDPTPIFATSVPEYTVPPVAPAAAVDPLVPAAAPATPQPVQPVHPLPPAAPTPPVVPAPAPPVTAAAPVTPAGSSADAAGPDLDAARAAYAAAEEALTAAKQHAAETYTDHTRLAAVSSDAQHAANQAEQARASATIEEQAAQEHLARAQAAAEKATQVTIASTRAARDLADRAMTVAADTERARIRAHEAAAAAQAAADHLDDVRAALARARAASHPADD